MRTVMSGFTRLLAASAGVLLAVGCSSSSDSGGQDVSTSSRPVSGGSVTFAVDTEPVSWDIHVSPQDITGELDRNIFDSLVSQDDTGAFKPWLATSWEAAKDLKTFTFTLRHDVTFTDGTPFNAAAVKANFDRIADPKTKSQYASSLLGPYTGTTVVDPYTVKVNFSAPFAPFLQAASTSYLGFYSPKAIAADAAKFGAGGPALVGTGPFVFSRYTKSQSAELTRNPAYKWAPATAEHQGPAYLDKLVFRFLPEPSVRVGALTSGQVDVARAVPAANVATVEANPRVTIARKKAPGGVYNLFLNASKAPFNDPLVRKAVQRAINIDQDVKTVEFGQYARAWSPLSPSTPGYDKKLENAWPYDPALANRLLDQAGWTTRDGDGYRTKNGRRLTAEWPQLPAASIRDNRAALGEAFQADLKKVGVQITRPTYDTGTYVTRAYGAKEDILDNSWARNEPDVLRLFFNSSGDLKKGGQNATVYSEPQLDKWTNDAAATLDPAARAALYAKTQQRVIDLATVVPVYVPSVLDGVGKKVKGFAFGPTAWSYFYDTWVTKK
jgi:peptide/nickel transport system substrate-binding protein